MRFFHFMVSHRLCYQHLLSSSELTGKIDTSNAILILKPTDFDGIGSTYLGNRL